MRGLSFRFWKTIGVSVFHFGIVAYVCEIVGADDIAVEVGLVLEGTLLFCDAFAEIIFGIQEDA